MTRKQGKMEKKKMKEKKLNKKKNWKTNRKRENLLVFFILWILIYSLWKTKLSIPFVLDPPSQIPPWNKTLEDFVEFVWCVFGKLEGLDALILVEYVWKTIFGKLLFNA
jgi:hypothetical protein